MAYSNTKATHSKKRRLVATKALGKSAISNGTLLFNGVEHRLAEVRRFRDLVRAIEADQNGEGLSEARLQLIRRFAGCCVLCEAIEGDIATGEHPDLIAYSQLISCLVRLARRIGIDRVAKDITPILSQYLASKKIGHAVGDIGDPGDEGI